MPHQYKLAHNTIHVLLEQLAWTPLTDQNACAEKDSREMVVFLKLPMNTRLVQSGLQPTIQAAALSVDQLLLDQVLDQDQLTQAQLEQDQQVPDQLTLDQAEADQPAQLTPDQVEADQQDQLIPDHLAQLDRLEHMPEPAMDAKISTSVLAVVLVVDILPVLAVIPPLFVVTPREDTLVASILLSEILISVLQLQVKLQSASM